MKRCGLAVLAISVFPLASLAAPAPKTQGDAAIIGQWEAQAISWDGRTFNYEPGSYRFTFATNGEYTHTADGKTPVKGSYTVDPKASSPTINWSGTDTDGIGGIARTGTYRIDGESMTILLSETPEHAETKVRFRRVKKD
jgi:uncharacterized protein (TIGR03067 family)